MKRSLSFFTKPCFLIIICLIGLVACGGGSSGGSTPPNTDTPTLSRIEITLEENEIAKETTTQAYATGIYSDNSSQDITTQVQWNSSSTNTASISNSGKITGLQAGTTTLSASLNSKQESSTLTVTAVTLRSISISPASPSLAKGLNQQLTANGVYTDGKIYDITDLVSWTSNDTAVASITGEGLLSGLTTGTATIAATLNGISSETQASITSATLSSIGISVATSEIPLGATAHLYATGIFSDYSTQDLTDQASWSSANNTIATVNASGVLTPVAAGETQITASYNNKSTTITITVTAATLSNIEISPVNPVIAEGNSQQFSATAIYSNGSSIDITSEATWASSNTGVSTIDNSTLNSGKAISIAAGTTTISAYYNGKDYQTTLTVTAAAITNIEIRPSNPSIVLGTEQQFTAIGHYSDGSTEDLTSQVIWSSSSTAVTSSYGNGLFKSVAVGTAQVTASVGGISSFTDLTITSATLSRIDVSPANTSVSNNTSVNFTATGNYSDSSTQDITQLVTWESADSSIASISNLSSMKGKLSTLSEGSTTISATLDGKSGSTGITVTPATLSSITIQVQNTEMYVGTQQLLTATGHYSDSSSLDISHLITWGSSDDGIASISNLDTDRGTLDVHSAGTATITATYNGISATTSITSNNNPDAPVSLSIKSFPNVILNNGSDSSAIEFKLQPAGSSGIIADNTAVNVQIKEGESVVSNSTVYTGNGIATINHSSNYNGFISIVATIDGTNISQSSAIFSTTSFSNVIARSAYVYKIYDTDNKTLLSGSWFALLVQNISNRDFNIESYDFKNNNVSKLLIAGSEISGGDLVAGEFTPIIINFETSLLDEGITGILTFSDTGTGQQFTVGAIFTQVAP